MRSRDRLQTLVRLAAHREAECARQLAERQRALHAEEERLRQIQGYLMDYERRSAAPGGVTHITGILGARNFLDRLRSAVREQQLTVDSHRRLAEAQAEQWRAARARNLALAKLVEKRAELRRRRQEQKDQRRLDEIALVGRH